MCICVRVLHSLLFSLLFAASKYNINLLNICICAGMYVCTYTQINMHIYTYICINKLKVCNLYLAVCTYNYVYILLAVTSDCLLLSPFCVVVVWISRIPLLVPQIKYLSNCRCYRWSTRFSNTSKCDNSTVKQINIHIYIHIYK